ncbi:ABC-type transport auxiliary lipoprotein family protein [Nitrosomonas sp. sh817]|uniref:ABC-type transport auxiliary lipoprotein family protein n=1 Tax=Nitrosomonas sp. sh817 TaxID=3070658 RepID=UPI0027DC07F5|nr:ABC-type transport auxiliary lipoprotein family protein [Nitrosomonas sp. sh817]
MIRMLQSILFISLISGCTPLQKTPGAISTYDFGVLYPSNMEMETATTQVPQSQFAKKSLLIADVSSPAWLDNTAIHYRLMYHNPAQTFTYGNSRWIAAPAALFTQQLRDRIASRLNEYVIKDSSTAKTDRILDIELKELVHLFETTTDSHVAFGLRASLIERNSRRLLAQKDLSITAKAPSPDAAGAVSAISTASNRIINELIDWLNSVSLND